MIKSLMISYNTNSKVIFKVALVDHCPVAMNRYFNNTLKQRNGMMDFEVKHYPVAGNNLDLKVFKRLERFKITSDEALKFMIDELEKECK